MGRKVAGGLCGLKQLPASSWGRLGASYALCLYWFVLILLYRGCQVMCRLVGRRHDVDGLTLRLPASEKRQGTKSRGASRSMGI